MTSKKKKTDPLRSQEAPVTQAMLYLVRDELKSHIISHESRFDAIDKRFDSFEAKIESMFLKVASEIQKMQAEIHRGNLLAEEQNARNKYVIDQHETLRYRCEKVEGRMDQHEKDLKVLLKARESESVPK